MKRSEFPFKLARTILTGWLLMSACADQTAPVREMKGGDGVLRLSLPGEPRSLNPNVAPLDEYALLLGQNIFSKLVALADNGGVLPDVAERWEQSWDGRTYTFYIRRGIRFHDGQPLTAEDVRATLARIDESSNAELGHHLASVRAPDASTVWAEVTRLLPSPPAVTFAFPGPPDASPSELGAEVVQQLGAIGVEVRPRPIAAYEYLERLQNDRDFDIVILSGNQGPDPDSLVARFGSAGSMQIMGYSNADLDGLLATGGQQLDPTSRASAYLRAQEILAADLPIAPLYETVRVSVFRDGIRGLPHEDAQGLVPDYAFNLVRLPRQSVQRQ